MSWSPQGTQHLVGDAVAYSVLEHTTPLTLSKVASSVLPPQERCVSDSVQLSGIVPQVSQSDSSTIIYYSSLIRPAHGEPHRLIVGSYLRYVTSLSLLWLDHTRRTWTFSPPHTGTNNFFFLLWSRKRSFIQALRASASPGEIASVVFFSSPLCMGIVHFSRKGTG